MRAFKGYLENAKMAIATSMLFISLFYRIFVILRDLLRSSYSVVYLRTEVINFSPVATDKIIFLLIS